MDDVEKRIYLALPGIQPRPPRQRFVAIPTEISLGSVFGYFVELKVLV
jgi:hypothetical protein